MKNSEIVGKVFGFIKVDFGEKIDMEKITVEIENGEKVGLFDWLNRQYERKITNGALIRMLFPRGFFINGDNSFSDDSLERFFLDDDFHDFSHMQVSEAWWNAPYRGGE